MRECFNIMDGVVATDNDTKDDGNVGTATTTPAVGGNPRTPGQEGWLDLPLRQDNNAT